MLLCFFFFFLRQHFLHALKVQVSQRCLWGTSCFYSPVEFPPLVWAALSKPGGDAACDAALSQSFLDKSLSLVERRVLLPSAFTGGGDAGGPWEWQPCCCHWTSGHDTHKQEMSEFCALNHRYYVCRCHDGSICNLKESPAQIPTSAQIIFVNLQQTLSLKIAVEFFFASAWIQTQSHRQLIKGHASAYLRRADYDWRGETTAGISHHLCCPFESSVWLRVCAGVLVRACRAASGLFPGLQRRRCFAVGSRVSSLLISSSDAEGTWGAQTPLCVSEVASDSHLEKLFEENLRPLEAARSEAFLGRSSQRRTSQLLMYVSSPNFEFQEMCSFSFIYFFLLNQTVTHWSILSSTSMTKRNGFLRILGK